MTSPAPIWLTVLVPIVVAIITGLITYLVQERRLSHALRLQEEKLNADFRLQEEKRNADLQLQKEKLSSDFRLQEEKLSNDFRLQEERLKTELRTEFMAEEAVKQLLNHPNWEQRYFAAIKRKIGGFDDQELRKLLVRSGAVRFEWQGKELWGLRERNRQQL